jgi:hypothetical protein
VRGGSAKSLARTKAAALGGAQDAVVVRAWNAAVVDSSSETTSLSTIIFFVARIILFTPSLHPSASSPRPSSPQIPIACAASPAAC